MAEPAPCPTCTRPIDDPQTCQTCGKVTCTDCAMYSEDGDYVWCDSCGERVLEEVAEHNQQFLKDLGHAGPTLQELLNLSRKAAVLPPPSLENGQWIVEDAGRLLDTLAAHSPRHLAAMARAESAEAELGRLQAALTPSAETKAAYMGEFRFRNTIRTHVTVPWDTVKEIMAAIRKRAQPRN